MRPLLAVLILAASCGTGARGAAPEGSAVRGNVVLIHIDTLRRDRLGCYGYGVPTSPAIDRLAADAVVFDHAYATAPWTIPSTSTMLTGFQPAVLGTNDIAALDQRAVTLAELFAERSYFTGAAVSHSFVSSRYGFDQGFAVFSESAVIGHGHITSPVVTARAMRILDSRDGAHPFFLLAHYFDPHYDFLMHDILNTYPGYRGPLLKVRRVGTLMSLARKGRLGPGDMRYLNALYDSEIRFTDRYVGVLLDVLREKGLYDDALIVLVSDHGEELGEREDHWIGHTAKVTEELLRVPLVIKLPGNRLAGRRIDVPVSLLDLMPTIARLSGLSIPAGLEGRPLDLDDPKKSERTLFAETRRWRQSQAVIHRGYKLVYNLKTKKKELFDLRADGHTLQDLSTSFPDIAAKLDGLRSEWMARLSADRKRTGFAGRKPFISKLELEQLTALGYIGVNAVGPATDHKDAGVDDEQPPDEEPEPKPSGL